MSEPLGDHNVDPPVAHETCDCCGKEDRFTVHGLTPMDGKLYCAWCLWESHAKANQRGDATMEGRPL